MASGAVRPCHSAMPWLGSPTWAVSASGSSTRVSVGPTKPPTREAAARMHRGEREAERLDG